jgi:hypothetical protein
MSAPGVLPSGEKAMFIFRDFVAADQFHQVGGTPMV